MGGLFFGHPDVGRVHRTRRAARHRRRRAGRRGHGQRAPVRGGAAGDRQPRARRSRTARNGSAQGRVPGDAGARAAQSARADPPGHADLDVCRRQRRAEALEPRGHHAAGQSHVVAARRPARYLAHHARHARAAHGDDRSRVRWWTPRWRHRGPSSMRNTTRSSVELPPAPLSIRRRSAAPGAGAVEPADECREVHRPARHDPAARHRGRRASSRFPSPTPASGCRRMRFPRCSRCSRR